METPTQFAPSIVDQQAYYDKRWPEENERPNRLELLRLIEILRGLYDTGINFATQPVRICDLGCGRGWISHHLSQFGEVTGVDLSAEGVRQAQKKWPHIRFVQGDITKFRNGENLFDIVVSSEVVEHVPDKAAFFDTVRHILRPNGHLIITTPNKKLYSIYKRSQAEQQPVEEWPTLGEIRSLAAPDFAIVRHQSFLFDCYYCGIFRVISAPKLIRLCRATGLEPFRLWFHRRFDLGLHQLFHARYIGRAG